ncbi:fibroblast growth factor receptor substrate 3-like [Xyrauchen texanus]|uniref:fibroblast growth factor receptor substrate 3-like n=1 Tax=Xyrauchen texanus TaxID=154827 RepID=UPI0022422C8F|nr:fibroblast growth factor receptor substrate 3-like [Xyrauchen texanus]
MGSCWSCLYRDTIQDNHPNKFKVTNVDDEGNQLGSGTMELTQTELILHTRKHDAIRWPYLCLRRYGYDSNLFSFESGRRCQTGQGIFAFKCSRAEEIFNLLQELMQCNSINVVEEPMIMTGHAPEMDMPRTPQTPNTPGYPMQGFPNGYPGYPISGDSSQPSLANDHRHSLMGPDNQTHTYVNTVGMETDLSSRHCVHSLPEVRPSTYPEASTTTTIRGGPVQGQPSLHCCPMDDPHKDPQVFLQPGAQEVKFMLGPMPAHRRLMERDRECHVTHSLRAPDGSSETEREEPVHMCNTHSYHHCHHQMHRHPSMEPCPESQLTYENINGLRGGRRQRLSPSTVSQSLGSSSSSSTTGDSRTYVHPHSLPLTHTHPSSLPPQSYVCDRGMGVGGYRRTALLNYENLPSLPPVWEYRALQREEEEDQDEDEDEYEEEEEEEYDEYEYSEGPVTPNGYHQESGRTSGTHRDALQNYVNTGKIQPPTHLRHGCPPHPHSPERANHVFNFDFRRQRAGGGRATCEQHGHHPPPPPTRQLNYIQVDLEGEPSGCLGHGGGAPVPQRPPALKRGMAAAAAAPSSQRGDFYAVIDLKKTAAMSNLQKALPRDDGTSRKTRHNSTDLPL